MEYLQEARTDSGHNNNHSSSKPTDSFQDYLQAQKHLKVQQQRQRRESLGRLFGSQRHSQQIPPNDSRGIGVVLSSDQDNNDNEHDLLVEGEAAPAPSHNKHRQVALNAMSVLGRRQPSTTKNTNEWQAFLNDHIMLRQRQTLNEEREGQYQGDGEKADATDYRDSKADNHRDSHHDSDHSMLTVPWYCRPVQRQRWGDMQSLPHINWGDLFFDLFFVAAAYNLGVMLMSSLGSSTDWPRGLVYFVGIFGPLFSAWENDVVYNSRYTLVDYAHRIVAVMRFLCVGVAVLSIKPIQYLADKHSVETFSLVLALLCESIIQVGLNLELYLFGEGDRESIQNHTKRKLLYQFIPVSLTYLIASIIAGYGFFNGSNDEKGYDEEDNHGAYASNTDYHLHGNNTHANHTNHTSDNNIDKEYNDRHFRLLGATASDCPSPPYPKDEANRYLAGAGDGCDDYGYEHDISTQWSIADVPLILCSGIYLFNILYTLYRKHKMDAESQDIKHHFVPNNVDYCIHRYGEWTMLMVGESILSLLIVETVEAREYYGIAAVGCLTVIVIQMLKFESEPSHSEDHALWRSLIAAALFSLLIQVLSVGLVAFGVSYKIMLTNVVVDEQEESKGSVHHRSLAAIPKISDQAVAILFSGSLTVVLMSLEMMLGTHKGVTRSYQLLFHEMEALHWSTLNWPLMFISLLKIGLITVCATLSIWLTHPSAVASAGFFIVTSMAITRIVGWGFVHHEEDIMNAVTDLMFQATDVGRDIMYATQSFAKKTLQVTGGSLGISERTGSSMASNEELAIERALDTSFDAVVVTDRIGTIRHVNNLVLSEFGYSSDHELVGENVSILVGGEEADRHHLYMERFNRNEERAATIGKQRRLQARRKNGEEFACIVGIKPVENTGLLVGYIRSLSQLHGIVRASQTGQQVDDTSFDSIVVTDPGGMILNVNLTTLGEFLYKSKDELVGESVSILINTGDAEDHGSYLATFDDNNSSTTKDVEQRIVQAKRKDNTMFPVTISVRRNPENGNLIAYIRNMTGNTPEDVSLKAKTKYICDDTSFDSIIVTDSEEGKILQVNATVVEDFGYAKSELIGQSISLLVGGGHGKHHHRYMKRFRQKKDQESALGKRRTLKARRKDGTEFSCVVALKRIPDTDWLVGYIRSTEGLTKKQITAEQESLSRLSTTPSGGSLGGRSRHTDSTGGIEGVDDESFDAIIVTSFSGEIRRVNQTVLDIFRYESKDELIGNNISLLVGGGDAENHDAYLERFNQEGRTTSQIGKQRMLYSRRKDGSQFPCIVGIKRTPKNDALIGWIRDISEVERPPVQITNMKLLDPVERLLDANAFDAIVVTTAKGVIRRVNQRTVREFGYSADELAGQNVSCLVGGKVSPKLHDRYMDRFAKGGREASTIGKQRILKSKRKDGSEFRCIVGIARIPDADGLLVGYIRNLEMTYEPNLDSMPSESDGASKSHASRESSLQTFGS